MKILILLFVPIIFAGYVVYYSITHKNYGKLKSSIIGCASYLLSFLVLILIFATLQIFTEEITTPKVEQYSKNETNVSILEQKESNIIINVDSIIETMRTDFSFTSDEFDESGKIWVEPKTKPRYHSQDAYYCYFQINKDKTASNFRFVIQYEADDWLFIKDCIFNIDSEIIRFIPKKMERDNEGGRIWEWCDQSIHGSDVDLIRKISTAEEVKIKFNGEQYYNTRTMKKKEIMSIKQTLKCYEDLGGKF